MLPIDIEKKLKEVKRYSSLIGDEVARDAINSLCYVVEKLTVETEHLKNVSQKR